MLNVLFFIIFLMVLKLLVCRVSWSVVCNFIFKFLLMKFDLLLKVRIKFIKSIVENDIFDVNWCDVIYDL